jgi:hypothetical protein
MNGNQARQNDMRGDLGLLGVHEPSRARDVRVRGRCHAALEKRRRRAPSPVRPGWGRGFEPAVIGTLCAVYLFEVLSRAIRLYRF